MNDDKAYDVEHLDSGRIIGYKWGSDNGGLVYDPNGHDVVGRIQTGVVRGELVLIADRPHHTGKRYSGDPVLWSNRPSKKFN